MTDKPKRYLATARYRVEWRRVDLDRPDGACMLYKASWVATDEVDAMDKAKALVKAYGWDTDLYTWCAFIEAV